MSFLAVVTALCCALAAQGLVHGIDAEKKLRHAAENGLVKAAEFKHRLRVCNAYPSDEAMEILLNKTEKVTKGPLPYKQCSDFETPLSAGDKLNFKVGEMNAGTFSIAELPRSDSILLLVAYRHDALLTAVSFESHVFANLMNAQVAIIDTYKGGRKSAVKIWDHPGQKDSRVEDLRYSSVVALEPGIFEVGLFAGNGTTEEIAFALAQAKSPLVALKQESYVVLRTGLEAKEGDSYDQDIVVFPHSDPSMLGGASRVAAPISMLAAVLALCLSH